MCFQFVHCMNMYESVADLKARVCGRGKRPPLSLCVAAGRKSNWTGLQLKQGVTHTSTTHGGGGKKNLKNQKVYCGKASRTKINKAAGAVGYDIMRIHHAENK